MNVLVDTPVWSVALRRRPQTSEASTSTELRDLIAESRVELIGPIRQELLSGLSDQRQYERLRDALRAFEDLELTTDDYERAAECFNICRGHGVQGSNTDFLICAAAERRELAIFTTDTDFLRYRQYLPVVLHQLPDTPS